MIQLPLQLFNPRQIDVDGLMDANGIVFVGKATHQFDGSWRCLANVGGALCLVEVKIKFGVEDLR